MKSKRTTAYLFHIITVAVVSASSDNSTSSSSWAQLQISPNTLGSMPYGSFRVNIYEHSNNHRIATPGRKKYFYTPIALLNHKSATSVFNNVTKQPEMRFQIEMWNEKVESEVVKYLNDFLDEYVKPNQVQVVPFEKVILASTSPSTAYSLSSNWLPYQLHKSLWFTLSCFEQKDCDQLAANMRFSPQQFENFKLLFSLESQTSQTKQTAIQIKAIVSGEMASALLQRFNQDKEALLTAQDEKRLLTETKTNIIVETFEDRDVLSLNSESQIYNILKDLLVSSRITIKEQNDKMWDSVFWNDDNYRPDKTSKTLNEIFTKLDAETQKKLSDAYESTNKFGSGVEANLGFISGKVNLETDFSRHGSTLKEGIDKFYKESKDHVEWDGVKFVPKPLFLSRINLGKLSDSQSLTDRSVRVRYSTAVLSIAINFVQYANLSPTDDWRNLQENVANLTKVLHDTIFNVSRVKSSLTGEQAELQATVINLVRELNETQMIVEDLKKKLNETYVNVAESKKKLNSSSFIIEKLRARLKYVVLNQTVIENEKRLFDLMAEPNSSLTEIETLLKSGVDINCINEEGLTPLLHLLATNPNEKGNLTDIVRILIQHGADVNATDLDDFSALHYLCWKYQNDNLIDVVRLLIENRIDLNSKDHRGSIALLFLCRFYSKDNIIDVIRLMIENGVIVNSQGKDGWSALLILCAVYSKDNLIDVIGLLIDNAVDVNLKGKDGWTALLLLCAIYPKDNLIDVVRLFLKNGVDVNSKTKDGWNALHYLCRSYKKRNLIEIIHILFQHGKLDVISNGQDARSLLRENYTQENVNDLLKILDEKVLA